MLNCLNFVKLASYLQYSHVSFMILSVIHFRLSTKSKSHKYCRQYLTSESGGFSVSVSLAEAQPQSLMLAAILQVSKQADWEYLQKSYWVLVGG